MSPFLRRPVFLVKVWLDQCAHEFGEPPCVAAGTPCYYTYQTCKDQDNFSRSSVAHRFCLNQGPQLPNAAPLVADVQDQEAEIRPGENITQVGNYKIKFLESPPRIWANPDKPLLITKQNKETAGTFWKNLWARHSDDYLYRPVEIWRGYWGSAESTYQLYFRGVLEEWNLTEDGAELICRDHLIRLREKAPDPQDSENVLTAAYSGGAAMNVSKAFQFTDPATVGGAGLVQIEDDTIPYPCYVSYTGRSLAGNQLTGCVAGKFGSPNDGHIAGCRVKNVLILAANNAAAGAGWAAVEGLPLDTCLLDLLVYQARISGLDLAALDLGVVLAEDAASDDDVLSCVGLEKLPSDGGVIRIGDELIRYSGKTSISGYQAVDQELGPRDGEHSLDQGAGVERKHFVRFETGPEDTALHRVSLNLMRTGPLEGTINLKLFADNAGDPGNNLKSLGGKNVSLVELNAYADLVWDSFAELAPSTAYWLGHSWDGARGEGELFQALQADAATTEYKHAQRDEGPFYGIAGLPLFKVEKVAGACAALYNCRRGLYNTEAAAHSSEVPVLLLEVSQERYRWWPAGLFKRIIYEPVKIWELVKELRESTMTEIWPDPDGMIRVSCAPSPWSLDLIPELTDNLHLLDEKPELVGKIKDRKTRIYCYYNPKEPGAGREPENYDLLGYWEIEKETEEQLGEKLSQEIFCPWIYRPSEVQWLARHQFIRYRYGSPVFSFSLSDEEAGNWPMGTFLLITTDQVVKADGTPRTQTMYRVIKRKDQGGRWRYWAVDISGGKEGMPYRVISTSELTCLYDQASEDDRRKYCFISDGATAEEPGTLGAAEDPPHLIQ